MHAHTRRRLRTIPRLLVMAAVLVSLAPALFALAFLVDVARFLGARTPFMGVRVLAFGMVYVVGEVLGLFLLLRAGRDVAKNYAVQLWWTGVLFAAVSRVFSLRFHVDGDECVGPGCVYLVRHASIIDTLVPSVFVTRAHGIKLRFVVKKELLEDPCLDIAGNRLPNHFVARNAADTDADLAAIRRLAAGCASDEGLLVYPEGTRFTDEKRTRALAALASSSSSSVSSLSSSGPSLLDRATALTRVLPPKPAGAFALLDGKRDADAVFIAHRGLEGFAHVADIWSGALVGKDVRVRMWRVSRAQIPIEREARTAWLYDEWAKVDAFVGAATAAG